MRRFSGLSDFRYLAGQGLAWVEHAGLLAAVANFTVMPGAFCWHVKGLFGQGALPLQTTPLGGALGLGLLQFTWFLSSVYLGGLYLTLFWGAQLRGLTQGAVGWVAAYRYAQKFHLLRMFPHLNLGSPYSGYFLGVMWLALGGLVWYLGLGALLVVDTSWAGSLGGLVAAVAYY